MIKKPIILKRGIEFVIFNAKWILIPFYLKLIYTLVLFLFHYVNRGIHNDDVTNVLEDVDIVMLGNLIKMIISGSYNSFVSKTHGYVGENIGSGLLKVKMATSLIGVSAIHLLKTFVAIDEHAILWDVIYKQVLIHGTFVISAVALARIDFWHTKSEAIELDTELREHASKDSHVTSEHV